MGRIRLAFTYVALTADALCRAVALLRFGIVPVNAALRSRDAYSVDRLPKAEREAAQTLLDDLAEFGIFVPAISR